MARTLTEIQTEIYSSYVVNMDNIGITIDTESWSATSLEKLICDVVAFSIWAIEKLFDTLRTEIDETIATKKPHSLRWYALKSKDFRFGYDLIPETDLYDDTGLTTEEIAASKIIKHAAVVEQEISTNRFGLRIKVATEVDQLLTALTNEQLEAFEEYIARIKDAGVAMLITTGPPDSLKLTLDIYYNPLVLKNDGSRVDGTVTEPVQDAIDAYLKILPFNGWLVLQYLVDYLQKVDGVVIVDLKQAQARYGVLPYATVAVKYLPDAGYLRLIDPDSLTINFFPQSVI